MGKQQKQTENKNEQVHGLFSGSDQMQQCLLSKESGEQEFAIVYILSARKPRPWNFVPRVPQLWEVVEALSGDIQ